MPSCLLFSTLCSKYQHKFYYYWQTFIIFLKILFKNSTLIWLVGKEALALFLHYLGVDS